MTPTQLRAYAAVVRMGSVRAAAGELGVSEASVSMHVAQLRREFHDPLYSRTASGLAFTPGGLRLASRAVQILGLQDRTIREVTQASGGRRLLRIAVTSLFAEHAAPGLIALFTKRADDLDVELSEHPDERLVALLASRTVDVAVGSGSGDTDGLVHQPFLDYEVLAVASPDRPEAAGDGLGSPPVDTTWLLGPSAAERTGPVSRMLRTLGVPERSQRIFQSDAAALEEVRRGAGIAIALRFAVAEELASGRLVALPGAHRRVRDQWSALALPFHDQPPTTAELLRFITTPRATQAMVRGSGVTAGRFRPAVHVTLWS